jgi:hypothetical protein
MSSTRAHGGTGEGGAELDVFGGGRTTLSGRADERRKWIALKRAVFTYLLDRRRARE